MQERQPDKLGWFAIMILLTSPARMSSVVTCHVSTFRGEFVPKVKKINDIYTSLPGNWYILQKLRTSFPFFMQANGAVRHKTRTLAIKAYPRHAHSLCDISRYTARL